MSKIVQNSQLKTGFIITANETFALTGVRLKQVKNGWIPAAYFSNQKEIPVKKIALIVFPKGFIYTVFFKPKN